MSREQHRYNFLLLRDGEEAALAFAKTVHKNYRLAVLQSRKRGHSKPHHASLPEYRRQFIESYLFYKQLFTK